MYRPQLSASTHQFLNGYYDIIFFRRSRLGWPVSPPLIRRDFTSAHLPLTLFTLYSDPSSDAPIMRPVAGWLVSSFWSASDGDVWGPGSRGYLVVLFTTIAISMRDRVCRYEVFYTPRTCCVVGYRLSPLSRKHMIRSDQHKRYSLEAVPGLNLQRFPLHHL